MDEFQQRRAAMIAKIQGDIEHNGFSMIGVMAGHNSPPFTYTIGLTQQGFPEMIMVGIDARHVGGVFNQYYDQLVTKQREPGPALIDDLFNLPTHIIEADPAIVIAKYAHSTGVWCEANGLTPRFVQWVWCDKEGHFPWEPEWDAQFDRYQPIMGSVEHLTK